MTTANETNEICLIACVLCHNYYDRGDRSPILLRCNHTFCCQCLETACLVENSSVICPRCHELSPVAGTVKATFPENSVFVKLLEHFELAANADKVPCSTCQNEFSASVRCIECEQYFCETCKACHNAMTLAKDHMVVLIKDYINMPREFFQPKGMCKKHVGTRLTLFCKNETCAQALCPACALVSHKNHDVCNLDETYLASKTELDTTITVITGLIEKSQLYRQGLYGQNEKLDATHHQLLQDIDESYNAVIEKLNKKRNQMCESVTADIEKQKTARNNQIEMAIHLENAMLDHVQHCQLASMYAGLTQLVDISKSLGRRGNTLSKKIKLPDVPIQDVPLNLDLFHQIDSIIEKPMMLVDLAKIRVCTEVTDATIARKSDVIKVTLLPQMSAGEKKKLTLKAAIHDPWKTKVEIQPSIMTVCSIVGSLKFRTEVRGDHKTAVDVNGQQVKEGLVFHSKKSGEELVKRVIFGTLGQSGKHRELHLPSVRLDSDRLNWKDCSISKDGCLINTPTTIFPSRLTCLNGVTARSAVSTKLTSYWQVGIQKHVLTSAELGFAAVETGICQQSYCDSNAQLANNKHAWCVNLGSCATHHGVCSQVYSRAVSVGHFQVAGFRLDSLVDADFGILLNAEKKVLHIIDVQSNEVICSVPDIDLSQPLIPVFGVYSPTMFQVKVRVTSGAELNLSSALMQLLSDLI